MWGGGGDIGFKHIPRAPIRGCSPNVGGGGGDIGFKHIPRAPIRGYSPNVGGILDLNTYPGRLYEGALLLEDIGFVYVIAWLGVKFGINFTSVVVRMAKIARGEAECNFAILTTTQVKFIPKFHS